MPVPAIAFASPGTQPNTLRISGSGFTGATAVAFGSALAASFSVISDTSISAVSASPLVLGPVNITVTTPGGSVTAAVGIGYVGPPPSANSAGYLGPVSSQSAMTALSASIGNFCLRVDLGELFYLIATPATSAANWSASTAVVDNADGTVLVSGVNALEPLSTVTIVTASTAPAVGQSTWYNATSGNLTPPLPALSGLRVGARLAVRRDPADVSNNTVTLTCAGSDTFYSSGATSTTLPMSGEQREYQVISVAGTKYYAPAGSLNPVAALDQRYLAGTSKLVNIGDLGYGATYSSYAASTVGTSEYSFKIGVAATNIAALFNHWYTTQSGAFPDTDPSGPITFSASLRVVSSTNPNTVVGTLYRLKFAGRITVTVDPGGRVVSEPVGVALAVGDVVAVRTYLSSGTAYAPRFTYQWVTNSEPNGFTATTDLTAPGSAAVTTTAAGFFYGPAALLGQTDASVNAKSVLAVGDSAISSLGDSTQFYRPELNIGGWQVRALSGVGGLLNMGVPSDSATWFQATGGSVLRYGNALRANSAIIEYGAADLNGLLITAAALEALNLNIAISLRRLGTARVFLTTIVPRTTSTDGWATTTNQTPATAEPQRVLYNTWVRARCPIDPTTHLAVSVGTAGALLAGQFGHPVTGTIDISTPVESALNSGFWLPAQRVTTVSTTASSQTLTSAGAGFKSAAIEAGGDKGTAISIPGAGAAGALFTGYVFTVTNSTTMTTTGAPATTLSNTAFNIGVSTTDGLHPSPRGHMLIAAAVNTAVL